MTPDERHAMTIAVAQAFVDQQAAHEKRGGPNYADPTAVAAIRNLSKKKQQRRNRRQK